MNEFNPFQAVKNAFPDSICKIKSFTGTPQGGVVVFARVYGEHTEIRVAQVDVHNRILNGIIVK